MNEYDSSILPGAGTKADPVENAERIVRATVAVENFIFTVLVVEAEKDKQIVRRNRSNTSIQENFKIFLSACV